MSDPTLSEVHFKNKMARVWATLWDKFIGRYSVEDDTVWRKISYIGRIEALYLIQTSNPSLFLELFSYAGRPFI